MSWRAAFLRQAKSDYQVYEHLSDDIASEHPLRPGKSTLGEA